MHYSQVLALLLAMLSGAHEPVDPTAHILTYKQYAKIQHDVPYVLEFEVGKGALLLYGGRHVFDASDQQIADIQKEWERFRPSVAYNEGGNPPTESSLQSAVERYGEAGLVRYLSAKAGVPVATFEPKRGDEARALLDRYSAEQVKVLLSLRSFLTFRKSKQKQTVDAYMAGVLGDPFWKANGLAGPPRSVAELEASCTKLFAGLKDWRDVPEDWFDPTRSDQFTNAAQNDSGLIRDKHIFSVLVKRAQQGDRVFAVIGASHVPVLEPALVSVLGKPARKRNGASQTGS